jgi:hypothetical protein
MQLLVLGVLLCCSMLSSAILPAVVGAAAALPGPPADTSAALLALSELGQRNMDEVFHTFMNSSNQQDLGELLLLVAKLSVQNDEEGGVSERLARGHLQCKCDNVCATALKLDGEGKTLRALLDERDVMLTAVKPAAKREAWSQSRADAVPLFASSEEVFVFTDDFDGGVQGLGWTEDYTLCDRGGDVANAFYVEDGVFGLRCTARLSDPGGSSSAPGIKGVSLEHSVCWPCVRYEAVAEIVPRGAIVSVDGPALCIGFRGYGNDISTKEILLRGNGWRVEVTS